jgi:predicted RNA methylase
MQRIARTALAATPIAAALTNPEPVAAIEQAARRLLPDLERGRRIDAAILRAAMERAFGGSDAEGAWDWKTAYDCCEAATVLFLRKFGPAMLGRAASPAAMLPMLAKIAVLLPTHTRRSEESQALQQFSTPIALGLAACTAAAITPADLVLEPSAGTGLLTILAELAGGALVLNELAEVGASLLDRLFPGVTVSRFDASQIDDHLGTGVSPSVVLMNPPFSAMAQVERRMADTTLRHVSSALARLADGGRLVAITGANFAPDNPAWADAFIQLQERGRVVFSAAIDGAVYAKHGTTIDTRLTVIDKQPADERCTFQASPGMAPDVATLLAGWCSTSLRGCRSLVPPPLPLFAAQSCLGRCSAPPSAHHPFRPLQSRPIPSDSPTRPWIGSPPRADASLRRFMKNTDCRRSAFPTLRRIPPSWCNQWRWHRSRPRNLPIGRICRPQSFRADCCRTHSLRASSMPARPIPVTWPDRGRSMRPSTSFRLRPMTRRMRFASAEAGLSVTAPGPAKAARLPASCSTTG